MKEENNSNNNNNNNNEINNNNNNINNNKNDTFICIYMALFSQVTEGLIALYRKYTCVLC